MKNQFSAYCFASGEIQVSKCVPSGAVVLATGPDKELKSEIDVVARHGYYNGQMLVPGLPESTSVEEAIKAVVKFVKWAGSCRSCPQCEWRQPAEIELELRGKVGVMDNDGNTADPEAFEVEASQ